MENVMVKIKRKSRQKEIRNKTSIKLPTKSTLYSMEKCLCPPKIRYGESDWFINWDSPYHFGTSVRNRQTRPISPYLEATVPQTCRTLTALFCIGKCSSPPQIQWVAEE